MTHQSKSAIFVGRVFSVTSIKTLWLFLLAALTLAAAPSPIRADVSAPQEQPKAKFAGDVFDASGAFKNSMAIDVPDFHGVEPKLGLVYSSSADNSFVGVGWSLNGLSFIERASPGGGAPRYDASDIYLLDGKELMTCATFGYCLKHKTYQRISFNPVPFSGKGEWTVTDKDGTKSLYQPLYSVGANAFRWALVTETDMDGNTVTYNYWCESGANCYPDTITYNGATITFYRELRPTTDRVSFANGSVVGATNYRLRWIGVKIGTAYARAYVLTYTDSADTKRSLLASVRQYGTDVGGFDANGVPTTGLSFPATTFTYTATSGNKLTTAGGVTAWFTGPMRTSCISGDYNQDGNSTDIACYIGGANNDEWYVWLSSPNGWVWGGYRYLVTGTSTSDITTKCLGGDFNRDGMSDVACYAGSGTWRVGLSTGGTPTSAPTWTVQNWTGGPTTDGYLVRDRCFVGDYNDDGRSDLACHNAGAWRVGLSSGSAWSNPNTIWAGPSVSSTIPVTERCLTGDFNGDGKTDISCQTGTQTGLWSTFLANATGTNFTSAGNWTAAAVALPVGNYCLTGDFNADGKIDLTCYSGSGGSWNTSLSTGNSFAAISPWANGPAPTGVAGDKCAASDTNADGRTDITCVLNTAGSWTTSHSLGNGWQSAISWTGSNLPGAWRDNCVSGDYNGDGRADITCVISTNPWTWQVGYPDGATGDKPDLLKIVNNGIGGKTTATYAPSSRWADYNTSASWLNLHEVPVGSVFPTVKEIKLQNDLTTLDTTAHTYQYAKWSYGLKEFVGFKRADSHPSDGVCTVMKFRQTDASPGMLEEMSVYANAGSLHPLHKSTRTYAESASAPYSSFVDEVEEMEQQGESTNYRTKKKKHYHDDYGNLEKVYHYGDSTNNNANTSDDKTIYSVYYPNTTDYVVDKPGLVQIFAGIGTGGTLLSQTRNHYDGNASHTSTPTKGNLTKASEWDNQRGASTLDTAHNHTLYGYDIYGNVTSITDPEGRVSNFTFNDLVNTTFNNVYQIKMCHVIPGAADQCTETKWDKTLGLVLESKDANNAVVKTGYDVLGRKTSETDAANNVTTWSYLYTGDPQSQRVRETRPDGSPADYFSSVGGLSTDTYYDGFGRIWYVEKEASEGWFWNESWQDWEYFITTYTQRTIYKNSSSQPWKQSHWYYGGGTPIYTVYDYDALGRLAMVTHPDGNFTTTSYLNCGTAGSSPGCVADNVGKPYVLTYGEMNQETRTWDDTAGRRIKVVEKEGTSTYHTTTFEYNLLGHLVKTTDALNNDTSATYDSLGRRLSETRATGVTWNYTYYKDGQLKTETDNKGQLTTLTYDGMGRLKTKVVGANTTTWYYDEAGYGASIGRLTRATYPGGSKTSTYDVRGLTIAGTDCIDAVCRNLASSYDAMGRRQTITYHDGEVVTYAYQTDGNLVSVSGYVSNMYWNSAGQLLSMTYVNGTTNTYTYDTNRQWMKTATAKKGATTRYTVTYDYDFSGRMTQKSEGTPTAVTTKYFYDSMNRLTEIKDGSNVLIQSYTYNAIGNITNNSQVGNYTYGDANHKHAATAAGSNTYTYDANGSMLTAPNATFVWDTENRLSSYTKLGVTTSMVYDEGEQRVKKTTGANVSRYFSELMEQIVGVDVQYYYAGPMLVAKKEAGVKVFYHLDTQGSTRLITNASGDEANDYDYKAFGAYLASASPSNTTRNEREYTGHINDAESGLIYMGGRYYAATLSRFISADDIIPDPRDPQSLNRYSYVYNNPMNDVDPDGHCPVIAMCVSAIVTGLAAATSAAMQGKSIGEIMKAGALGLAAGFVGGGMNKFFVKEMVLKRIFKVDGPLVKKAAGLLSPLTSGGANAYATAAANHYGITDNLSKSDAFFAGFGSTGARLGVIWKKLGVPGGYKELVEAAEAKGITAVTKAVRDPAAAAFISGVAARNIINKHGDPSAVRALRSQRVDTMQHADEQIKNYQRVLNTAGLDRRRYEQAAMKVRHFRRLKAQWKRMRFPNPDGCNGIISARVMCGAVQGAIGGRRN